MDELIQEIALADFGHTAKHVTHAIQTKEIASIKEIQAYTGFDRFDISNILGKNYEDLYIAILLKHN